MKKKSEIRGRRDGLKSALQAMEDYKFSNAKNYIRHRLRELQDVLED